ncbi:rod shape-determining protein MreC [methanotrophic endosymbiont of Bathymodiolus puteoserpentis (Logatchev)]|uniref:rod shape-determining protein MreC n=1 Tax=methanotrophic endosymbiont of Bathymodiolus puteoserpentis (Logatchev) TaxID=343235 RepID=UPI00157AFD09|nr:rod shape-determining protein MreC [methanotrophic endosymbiont of Bathymodiolus puteoserpentis (Logatchev)]
MKLLFATGPSINTRFLIVVLLSVFFLVTEQYSDKLKPLRHILSVFVYPIQYIVDAPTRLFNNVINSVEGYEQLLSENKVLKQQQLINSARLLKFSALEKENIRLRSLLDSSFKLGEQVLIAELLSVNLAPYEHVVVVNKGSRFGVHVGQPVLDANGIVGQVLKALPLSSEIILITDPNHAIPVQVNRNGLHTIAIGSGQLNKLNLPFLPNNADIVPGDLLITSGLGGIFPQGYPVAVVESFVEQPDKPFAVIQARPTAALNTSRELLIVWSNSQVIPLNNPLSEQVHGQD